MYILLWDRSDPYDAGQQDGVARPVKKEIAIFRGREATMKVVFTPKQTLVFTRHHSPCNEPDLAGVGTQLQQTTAAAVATFNFEN
jgi:hypothetical protein